MTTGSIFLMVLIALIIGYVMGIYQRRAEPEELEEQRSDEQALLKSLGLILRDESDAGLDQFIHRLDVTPATLDTHLAVGTLFRRKGEVSRAIKVHQNLISRPSLSKAQRLNAQLELARDFYQAGLLDRAERLLLELFDADDVSRDDVANLLVEIYQDEKEWPKAIDIVDRLGKGWFTKLSEEWQLIRAHFCCEQATVALKAGDMLEARRLLKQARLQQKGLARACLLLADIEMQAGNRAAAVGAINQAVLSGFDYVFPAIPLLSELAQDPKHRASAIELLRQGWRESALAACLLKESELEASRDLEESLNILLLALRDRPNLRLLHRYLTLLQSRSSDVAELNETLDKVAARLDAMPQYRCGHCGFTAKQLHWLCPSCKRWGGLAPIKGLEGV
ncbi:tetratricopeptide repeat protein [Simiduia agarivorans]|uniref:Lipopolysaccharide assembly protein B n=1 Tax=Simiduia agarivorans (strain DSM 21679 / JCM 13881 / BCRC 17597 / SA1) TaxID=1117647 RepID=K4KFA4_SIMAS|nr:tetratricopeptide repeat protein [Simiduia agarivorans]AFU97734.1 tetratricopeptide repeat protein [Simiduia agarivorans SA1 = DSM 21679]